MVAGRDRSISITAMLRGIAALGALAPLLAACAGTGPTVMSPAAPQVTVKHNGRTKLQVEVRGADQPFWLVLGESQSPGWQATLRGGRSLGSSQLEGQNLHDRIGGNTADAYIKPGKDPKGTAALAFHRAAHVRRAEVKAKGNYASGKKYRIEYVFRVERAWEKLVVFQW